jgi:hypothetical protein
MVLSAAFRRGPSASCGPFAPGCARHESRNGYGTAQETAGLNGVAASVLFLLHYDGHRVEATLQFSAYRLQTRGERSRPRSSRGAVSQYSLSVYSFYSHLTEGKTLSAFSGVSLLKTLVTPDTNGIVSI